MVKGWVLLIAGLASLSSLYAAEAGKFYTDGPASKAAIALSFDDGPGLYTERVLNILDQEKVKATFFMNGDQVQIRPQLAQEVKKRGHEIGDHTWSHLNFFAFEKKNGPEAAGAKARDEISKSVAIIEKTCAVKVQILRMPNGFSRSYVRSIAKERGLALVNWTHGEDWLNVPEEKMTAGYLKMVRPGAIFLFHDGGKNREKTLKIVPQLIAKARAKGLAVITVGEMLLHE
jgi:peptidoglycan-N-acetylglucosamine deacetylase